MLSDADALMVVVPLTVAPFNGVVIEAVGGVVSATLETVTVIGDEVAVLPAASLAIAVIVYWPFKIGIVFQDIE